MIHTKVDLITLVENAENEKQNTMLALGSGKTASGCPG
jgi:hypothetical protein